MTTPSNSAASNHPPSFRKHADKGRGGQKVRGLGLEKQLALRCTDDTHSRWRVGPRARPMRYECATRSSASRRAPPGLRTERDSRRNPLPSWRAYDPNNIGQTERAGGNVALVNIVRIAKALEIEQEGVVRAVYGGADGEAALSNVKLRAAFMTHSDVHGPTCDPEESIYLWLGGLVPRLSRGIISIAQTRKVATVCPHRPANSAAQ